MKNGKQKESAGDAEVEGAFALIYDDPWTPEYVKAFDTVGWKIVSKYDSSIQWPAERNEEQFDAAQRRHDHAWAGSLLREIHERKHWKVIAGGKVINFRRGDKAPCRD